MITNTPPTAQDTIKNLFDYGIDIDSRRIYFFGDVERDLVDITIRSIAFFNSSVMSDIADRPVEIIIASDGGDVHHMYALYDAIRLSKVPIHTICTGVVASAATLILVSGHKRFATPNSFIMHHQISADIAGNLDELTTQTKVTKVMATAFYQIMGKHTNKPAKFWEQTAKRKNELWLQPDKMLEFGVIDEIIKEAI